MDAGPVVVDLMVVERHHEGVRGMRSLQIRIRPIEGVAIAMIVDVVAVMGDEINLCLLGDVPTCGEEATGNLPK
jgi:hypothetical protein